MSDIEDFVDDNAENESLDTENVEPAEQRCTSGKGKRGKDIPWMEIKTFLTIKEYENSDIFSEVQDIFTARVNRETEYADSTRYTCKYARKVGWKVCPMMYRVRFLAHNDEVVVESYGNAHLHEEQEDNDDNNGVNFKWTSAMTEIVLQGCRNEANPAVILRNLKDFNLFPEGKGPSRQQLNNKISYCRRLLHKTSEIFTTGELRQKINEHLNVPDDENEAYIAHYDIEDENEEDEPRFIIIWTSKKLLARMSGGLTQDDATYRCVDSNLIFLGLYLH